MLIRSKGDERLSCGLEDYELDIFLTGKGLVKLFAYTIMMLF